MQFNFVGTRHLITENDFQNTAGNIDYSERKSKRRRGHKAVKAAESMKSDNEGRSAAAARAREGERPTCKATQAEIRERGS